MSDTLRIKNVRYRMCWSRLALWRSFDYADVLGAGGSERLFTLWPKHLWWSFQDWWRDV